MSTSSSVLVQIGTTNSCNEKCYFCSTTTSTRPKSIMPMDTFKAIVDSDASGIYDLCFTGEPLVDPLIVERVRYTRTRRPGSEIYFHTNGILLSRTTTDNLRQAGLSRIVVSVYGFGQGTHSVYQPVGSWSRLVENVTYCATQIPTLVVGTWLEHDQSASEKFWTGLGASVHYNSLFDFGDSTTAPSELPPVQRCTLALGYHTYDHVGQMVRCCLDFESRTAFGKIAEETWDTAVVRVNDVHNFCRTCARVDELTAWLSQRGLGRPDDAVPAAAGFV